MIEKNLIASLVVGFASLFLLAYKEIFGQKQRPIRIPVRIEDDQVSRRIRIVHK